MARAMVAYSDSMGSSSNPWLRIVRAINHRELKTRYTGDAVGYAWSLVLPLTWIVMIWLLFAVLGRPIPIDTDPGTFIFTGVVPYASFRYTLTAVMRAKLTYTKLFVIPRVNPEIVCFSVALLEIVNAFVLYGFVMLGNWMLFGHLELQDPMLVARGLILASLLGSCFAYFVVGIISNVRFAMRAMQVVVRPIFYLSGVFFIASELPSSIQQWVWFNPVLHTVEIVRTGAVGDYGSRHNETWLPLAFCLAFLVAGYLASRMGGIFEGSDEEFEV